MEIKRNRILSKKAALMKYVNIPLGFLTVVMLVVKNINLVLSLNIGM